MMTSNDTVPNVAALSQVKMSHKFLLNFLFERHRYLKAKVTTCIANKHISKERSCLQIKRSNMPKYCAIMKINHNFNNSIQFFPSKGRRN